MSLNFEEIDYQTTPLGALILRRRRMEQFRDEDIFEVKLGEDFLMTSAFHESEDQVSHLGLKALNGKKLDIVVGGLGLGYTAVAALEDPRVSSLVVVEYLEAVIGWHKNELVPMGPVLNKDPRCRIVHADFFEAAQNPKLGLDPTRPENQFDAILLDIDHTPTQVLNQTNKEFYTIEGLGRMKQQLKSGGVFSLWADGPPADLFTDHLQGVFARAESHLIEFDNPITESTSKGTVYLAWV